MKYIKNLQWLFALVASITTFAAQSEEQTLEERFQALEQRVQVLEAQVAGQVAAGQASQAAAAQAAQAAQASAVVGFMGGLIPGASGLTNSLSSISGASAIPGMDLTDLPSAGTALERTMRSALADFSEAESYFAKARGDAESAAANESRAAKLRGEDEIDIKEAIDETVSSRAAGAEFEASASELNDEAKALYGKGLIKYASGMAGTSKLSIGAKDFLSAAKNEMTGLNPMKIMRMRKTLGDGMKIAKLVPGFFKAAGSSSKGVFSFARAQKLDTKDAEAALPDDEFE
ncbi:hypothetical protein N8Z64_01990 [Pseudomonadales bacterium]|jgi:hypothetical protein|nr:hypothetical protein [Pseudomonadales bacterium]MDC1298310.1 hypothetical protein [Pseudomonadales bacterium]